jgi:hypothetical protein
MPRESNALGGVYAPTMPSGLWFFHGPRVNLHSQCGRVILEIPRVEPT